MKKEELMRKAIELSIENVANGGGPFGAVIAKDGEIIATEPIVSPHNATLPPMRKSAPSVRRQANWEHST